MIIAIFAIMRTRVIIPYADDFREKLLGWCSAQETAFFYESNPGAHLVPVKYEFICAAGALGTVVSPFDGKALEQLPAISAAGDWMFGFLSYDLKNEIEELDSLNPAGVDFPALYFFRPRYVFFLKEGRICIEYMQGVDDEPSVLHMLAEIAGRTVHEPRHAALAVPAQPRTGRSEYIETIRKLKDHIKKGDIYEVNFCQELFAENALINPLDVYNDLNSISQAPYSAFCRFNDKYVISASPERFLSKEGSRIVSQPIKGTARRGRNEEEDEQLKQALAQSEKERSENVMIVDLVRNDLSRIAARGSVKVDELFGIYTFRQVHQMISTISAELREGAGLQDIIRAAFPMGSMTGAPKVRAMQLIEQYESARRGLYSGALGYIDPHGDFDFSVVIRTILYDATSKYLSFMVGGAITEGSDPEKEYEECMVKAAAMMKVLSGE